MGRQHSVFTINKFSGSSPGVTGPTNADIYTDFELDCEKCFNCVVSERT